MHYFSKKVIQAVMLVVLVVVANFFLFRLLPGDPTYRIGGGGCKTQQDCDRLRAFLGLDKPVINCIDTLHPFKVGSCAIYPLETQFFVYIADLLQGNLGESFQQRESVATLLYHRTWSTLTLIGPGQIMAIVLGVGLGIVGGWYHRKFIDQAILFGSLATWSLPLFWLGTVLLLWGGTLGFPMLPYTPGQSFEMASEAWENWLDYVTLPTLVFVVVFAGEYAVLTRNLLVEQLKQDYIRTARAKGIAPMGLVIWHGLRNISTPLMTFAGLNLAFTVAGSVQIEAAFSWPGLGLLIVDAARTYDYPVLQGAFLVLTIVVILANLLVDLLNGLLDPRLLQESNDVF